MQFVQSDSSTLPEALEKVPDEQGVGVSEPCGQYRPGGQTVLEGLASMSPPGQ